MVTKTPQSETESVTEIETKSSSNNDDSVYIINDQNEEAKKEIYGGESISFNISISDLVEKISSESPSSIVSDEYPSSSKDYSTESEDSSDISESEPETKDEESSGSEYDHPYLLNNAEKITSKTPDGKLERHEIVSKEKASLNTQTNSPQKPGNLEVYISNGSYNRTSITKVGGKLQTNIQERNDSIHSGTSLSIDEEPTLKSSKTNGVFLSKNHDHRKEIFKRYLVKLQHTTIINDHESHRNVMEIRTKSLKDSPQNHEASKTIHTEAKINSAHHYHQENTEHEAVKKPASKSLELHPSIINFTLNAVIFQPMFNEFRADEPQMNSFKSSKAAGMKEVRAISKLSNQKQCFVISFCKSFKETSAYVFFVNRQKGHIYLASVDLNDHQYKMVLLNPYFNQPRFYDARSISSKNAAVSKFAGGNDSAYPVLRSKGNYESSFFRSEMFV